MGSTEPTLAERAAALADKHASIAGDEPDDILWHYIAQLARGDHSALGRSRSPLEPFRQGAERGDPVMVRVGSEAFLGLLAGQQTGPGGEGYVTALIPSIGGPNEPGGAGYFKNPDVLPVSRHQRSMLASLLQSERNVVPDLVKDAVSKPWGWYLDHVRRPDFVYKTITVYPGAQLSLQRHRLRDEVWFVARGTIGVVVDDRQWRAHQGESIYVPAGAVHRIQNPDTQDTAVVKEVQVGKCDEDDIERIEDDYGRTSSGRT